MADLDGRIGRHVTLVAAHAVLLGADLASALGQGGDGFEVKVGVEAPEEGAGDADEGPVGELAPAPLHGGKGVVDDDLVVAGLDEPARHVLELLAGLDEQVVAGRDLDGDAGARVAGPDVEPQVAGAAVDGEEVEVGVEAVEDGVLLAVLVQVRGGRGQEERVRDKGVLGKGGSRALEAGGWKGRLKWARGERGQQGKRRVQDREDEGEAGRSRTPSDRRVKKADHGDNACV